ncbi:MAG: ATP-binding protein [Phaeodactylibacter sp.]|uniref:ATP-binding protein n=1 Tax=Phaeodactylibacter sp. TaxID=1940289 RepID=UPI0032EE95CB
MLTKLVLINSCAYKMAEVGFEHGHSLQLVGPNNVGKSSLIYALNFLFLVNKRLMNFSGQRTADKETLAHYFPSPERSFILFEVKKRDRRYCMLVHRNADNEVLYTRIDHSYQRSDFFEEQADGQHLRSYKELMRTVVKAGAKVKKVDQVQEILKHIYQVGDRNDAVVWLTDKCKISGTYNSFNKVYRYLINSKLIDNRALKDILLIADSRDQDELSYSRQNIQQIDRLRYQSQQLAVLKNIETEFSQFKNLVGEVEAHYELLCQQAATFFASANLRRAVLMEQRHRKKQEIETLEAELAAKSVENDRINQQKGRLDYELRQLKEAAARLEQQQKEALELPAESLLEQQLQNQQSQVEQLWFRLQQYAAHASQPTDQLQRRIDRLDQQIQRKVAQQTDINDWLVAHLAKEDTHRRLLNSILHPDIARLPQSQIKKPVTKATRLIELFDGQIELPEDFVLQEVSNPEQLAEEVAELQQERDRYAQLMDTARNSAELKAQLEAARAERQRLEEALRQVRTLPEIKNELKNEQQAIRKQEKQLKILEQEYRTVQEDLQRRQSAVRQLQEEVLNIEQSTRDLERDQREIEEMNLPTMEPSAQEMVRTPEAIRQLFAQVKQLRKEIVQKREARQRLFQQLKDKTQFDLADEQQFVLQLEQEMLSVADKQQSIESLLESIAVQFANPAQRFLDAYEEFKAFVHHEFNRTLGEIQISNLESLNVLLEPNERLQDDLRAIAELSLTTDGLFRMPDHTAKRLDILREYLEKGQAIAFSDLFNLQLRLSINGKVRSVNLGRQVESDGTDRMLRLIIVMAVISRLSQRSPDNRVVLFIDEIATIDGKNRPQLVEFCKEHHFYPIFAAPDIVDGFDQYLLIQRQPSGQLVVDEQKHVIQVAQAV